MRCLIGKERPHDEPATGQPESETWDMRSRRRASSLRQGAPRRKASATTKGVSRSLTCKTPRARPHREPGNYRHGNARPNCAPGDFVGEYLPTEKATRQQNNSGKLASRPALTKTEWGVTPPTQKSAGNAITEYPNSWDVRTQHLPGLHGISKIHNGHCANCSKFTIAGIQNWVC